jgi:hypothetical protein
LWQGIGSGRRRGTQTDIAHWIGQHFIAQGADAASVPGWQKRMTAAQKIGILTFHRCINYGSYWQARCLVEGLRAEGHDAVLLDYASCRANWAEWRCALQPLLPVVTPKADFPLYSAKTRRFFQAFSKLPLSAPFPLDNPAEMDSYDLVIIGSDEVWNLSHPWYGGYPLFFGDGLHANRVASYAASFGNHERSAGLESFWAERLAHISQISIRDDNSRQLIRDALGCDPELVLDPCLQFPDMIEAGRRDEREAYGAVYGHSFPHWFRQAVQEWARARNYRLVSIGYRNDWADEQWISAGPEEFAGFMAGAEAVATNFFHGCVFALLNRKPFACAPSDYRFNKVRDLAATVGAERHLVGEATPSLHYGDILGEALEPEIPARIANLRQKSNAYLHDVLD